MNDSRSSPESGRLVNEMELDTTTEERDGRAGY